MSTSYTHTSLSDQWTHAAQYSHSTVSSTAYPSSYTPPTQNPSLNQTHSHPAQNYPSAHFHPSRSTSSSNWTLSDSPDDSQYAAWPRPLNCSLPRAHGVDACWSECCHCCAIAGWYRTAHMIRPRPVVLSWPWLSHWYPSSPLSLRRWSHLRPEFHWGISEFLRVSRFQFLLRRPSSCHWWTRLWWLGVRGGVTGAGDVENGDVDRENCVFGVVEVVLDGGWHFDAGWGENSDFGDY